MAAGAAIVVGLVALVVSIGAFGGAAPGPSSSPEAILPSAPSEAPIPPLPSGVNPGTGERVTIPDTVVPARVDLYPSTPSVAPGQPLELHVSTPASEYSLLVERLDALAPGGGVPIGRVDHRPGHDFRRLATIDPATLTARANWPVTDQVSTQGWQPGVYEVTATDQAGTVGHALVVVRTPTIDHARPLFAVSVLTFQAYNLWGGANLYSYAGARATVVSFDRPYLDEDGLSLWNRGDGRLLAWLQLRGLALQYTTDYDLAATPPTVAPRLLILGRHTEYVPEGFRDWVERHVNGSGDMNLLNFGANSFYWRARLQAPPAPSLSMDLACYKFLAGDPVAASDPADATVQWRQAPIDRPEGALLGAQYAGIIDFGSRRFDVQVAATMPPAFLVGTGWQPGTILRGLMRGEGDDVYPGAGATVLMTATATGDQGQPLHLSVTIRTSPAGARVFDAGTFAWSDGFDPPAVALGVAPGSFDRFTDNVLAWLGASPPRP